MYTMYTHMCMCISNIYIYIYIYIHVCVCMYVCVYIYIYSPDILEVLLCGLAVDIESTKFSRDNLSREIGRMQ